MKNKHPLLLTLGVGEMWAEDNKGFFTTGQWNVKYWTGGEDAWGAGYDNASTYDLGIQSTI